METDLLCLCPDDCLASLLEAGVGGKLRLKARGELREDDGRWVLSKVCRRPGLTGRERRLPRENGFRGFANEKLLPLETPFVGREAPLWC